MSSRMAVILGLCLIVSSLILGGAFFRAKQTQQTIQVVGYATEEIESDIVKWTVSFAEGAPLDNVAEGYRKIKDKADTFKRIWDEAGITSEEFRLFPITVRKRYGRDSEPESNIVEQKIYVISRDIDKVEKLAAGDTKLMDNNVAFESSDIEYHCSDLQEAKKELLKKAMINARERADEIISATGDRVDKLKSASSGVFQITEPYNVNVSDYGMYDTTSRKKNIKVTVRANFIIK
jgi:uncharacterized protein